MGVEVERGVAEDEGVAVEEEFVSTCARDVEAEEGAATGAGRVTTVVSMKVEVVVNALELGSGETVTKTVCTTVAVDVAVAVSVDITVVPAALPVAVMEDVGIEEELATDVEDVEVSLEAIGAWAAPPKNGVGTRVWLALGVGRPFGYESKKMSSCAPSRKL